jgi:MFS family permease
VLVVSVWSGVVRAVCGAVVERAFPSKGGQTCDHFQQKGAVVRSISAPLLFVGFILSIGGWLMCAFGASEPWRATWLVVGAACLIVATAVETFGHEDHRELTGPGFFFLVVLDLAILATIGVGGAS